MYKLSIILGWPVIKMQLMSAYQVEHLEVWNKIYQHRIIISDSIDRYYSEKAAEEGLLDEYQEFMREFLGSDLYTEIKDVEKDLSKNISHFLKNMNKEVAVTIGLNEDFSISKTTCRHQYTIEEAALDENGPFAMYSVKASFFRKKDESARECIEWLKNQFKYETEINIIDQYILNKERNYNCLINYIIPIIPRGCLVNIHTIENAQYIDQIAEDIQDSNITVKVIKYRDMHNRYITTSDRIISIQLGVDFMKEKFGRLVIRKSTDFTLKKKATDRAYLEVEAELAGVLVE